MVPSYDSLRELHASRPPSPMPSEGQVQEKAEALSICFDACGAEDSQAVPSEGIGQLPVHSSSRTVAVPSQDGSSTPASREPELGLVDCARHHPDSSPRVIKRENGFDSPTAYVDFTEAHVSVPYRVGFRPSPPICAVQVESSSYPLKSSLMSGRGLRKHAKFCEEADWVMFDEDDPDQEATYAKKPIRSDGRSRRMMPRSTVQHNAEASVLDISWQEQLTSTMEEVPIGIAVTGQAHLLRCRSFEFDENGMLVSQYTGPNRLTPPARSPFSCVACTSVSTADEWRQPSDDWILPVRVT
jgi:hypothetical protein